MKATWDATDIPNLQVRIATVLEKRQAECDAAHAPVKAAIAKYNALGWFAKWFATKPMTGWCTANPDECAYMWARSALHDVKQLRNRVDFTMANNVTSITLSVDELEILRDL